MNFNKLGIFLLAKAPNKHNTITVPVKEKWDAPIYVSFLILAEYLMWYHVICFYCLASCFEVDMKGYKQLTKTSILYNEKNIFLTLHPPIPLSSSTSTICNSITIHQVLNSSRILWTIGPLLLDFLNAFFIPFSYLFFYWDKENQA